MTTSPPTQLDDMALYGLAEDFIDALLSAADVDVIGASRWWERGKTAIETAAASSDSIHACVAKAARKLQIESPSDHLANVTKTLVDKLHDPDTFRAWARLVARDAITIAAIVRERRTARRNTKTAAKTTAPDTKTNTTAEEAPECLPF